MKKQKGHEHLLTVTEVMNKHNIKFKKGNINLLEGFAGSGKTYFIMNDFINNTIKYTEMQGELNQLKYKLSKVLYVCDTKMLKDSVLNEYSAITNSLQKGGLIEAKDFDSLQKIASEDNGSIKVITYQNLSLLMCDDKCKYIINNYFRCIIMDEFHNLFNYNNRYKSESIGMLINNLNSLANNVYLIAITATTQSIKAYQYNNDNILNIKHVFTDNQLNTLDRHFAAYTQYYHSGWNMIKDVNWNLLINKGYKALVYTDFISTQKAYEEYFSKLGLNSCWLCSDGAINKIIDIDSEGNEIEITTPIMTKEQKEVREYLIKNNEIPKSIDILIVNSAYETGWNLKDKEEKIQIVLIDSVRQDTHIQANRVRHDIMHLGLKWSNVDNDGYLLNNNGAYKKQYYIILKDGKKVYYYNEELDKIEGIKIKTKIPFIDVPDKYLGIKLTKKLRDELIYFYAFRGINDRKATWKTLKRDLKQNGYIIETNSKGTYIFKEGQQIKKDSKRIVNKMNKLIQFLKENDGNYIYEEDINKLIKISNIVKPDGTLQDKPKKINDYFSSIDINYTILNKPSNGKKRWKVESYD